MASCYAAVAALVELLEDVITNHDRYPNLPFCRPQILKSLLEKFSYLQQSFPDYSAEGDEAAARVENRIRDAVYRTQNIIELEISDQFDSERTPCDEVITTAQRFYYPREVDLVELVKVEQEVNFIVEEARAMGQRHREENLLIKKYAAASATGVSEQIPKDTNTMVGFDQYLIAIKEQLCGQSSQLRIIPIVGMGGIGKTTLARNTFDSSLILCHFDYRVWITISQNYSAKRVFQTILKSFGIEIDDVREEQDEVVLKLRAFQSLKGRRYLIVIDDLWSTHVWDDMKQIFPDDSNGSRIILTTRLVDVALYASSREFIHEIYFLDDDASWSLLQEKVFAHEHCPVELVGIGKSIASKCRGLPLAIVVIAGMISHVRTPQSWENVAQNVGAILSRGDESLFNILSLSFIHLSPRLKTCFLYMGSFPEDYEISTFKLTRLWVAEGFLKSLGESKTLEQVANECLEDLVKRNLVNISKRRTNGQFKCCTMHDLLRDFCRERALREYFFHDVDSEGDLCKRGVEHVHRVIIPSSYITCKPRTFENCKLVRSILSFDHWSCGINEIMESVGFELLKVLNICETHFLFPLVVLQMSVHLKYLALRLVTSDTYFLPSIFKALNLQTLIIDTPGLLNISLPPDFWQMSQLSHLIIKGVELAPLTLVDGAPIRKLEFLQTLETLKNFIFTNEAIEMIPNLRKLKILYINGEATDIWEQYRLNNLVHLYQLEELTITFHPFKFPYVESFCGRFVPPSSLQKLSLSGCRLLWKELSAAASSLPCLQVLKLRYNAVVGGVWEPEVGEFPELKFLLMESLDLKYWKADDTHFPLLEHLNINMCFELEEIPLEFGDISTLKSITVYDSKLAGESANKILGEQQSLGNDALQVLVGFKFVARELELEVRNWPSSADGGDVGGSAFSWEALFQS